MRARTAAAARRGSQSERRRERNGSGRDEIHGPFHWGLLSGWAPDRAPSRTPDTFGARILLRDPNGPLRAAFLGSPRYPGSSTNIRRLAGRHTMMPGGARRLTIATDAGVARWCLKVSEMSDIASHPSAAKKAVIYRMVMPEHTCPWGLKAVDLLKR